jgi:DNA-binding NtrC family response regulator
MNNTGPLVYVVDDDPFARDGVADLVRSAGLMVKTFASGEEFLNAPRARVPSCLVLDVNLPGVSGLELQQELAKSDVQIPIIFLTGHGDISMSVRAVKAGAFNFLSKPVDDEELLCAVRQCVAFPGKERLHFESETRSGYSFENIVGKSKALQNVLEQVAIVAPTDATVLLEGETGTGKELIAHAVHNLSPRKNRNFVRLNCAAIPSGLLESELFGHEKGAFTGALMQRKGRFEIADGGTLFLDEIGDISMELQSKLLRVLQEHEFERLGSTRTIQVNVRVIAATHRDLPAMIEKNEFREDLFYRLNVFPIAIPPLRERPDDIPLLVNHLVSKLARQLGKKINSIPRQAMALLVNASWPGNVRELENLIQRAVILTEGSELNIPVDSLCSADTAEHRWVSSSHDPHRQAVSDALRTASGRLTGSDVAAERLGLKRTTLKTRMHRLGSGQADEVDSGTRHSFSDAESLRSPVAELATSSEICAGTPLTFHQAQSNIIIAALKETSGRLSGGGGAAERLGLKRSTLMTKMQKLNIRRADYSS